MIANGDSPPPDWRQRLIRELEFGREIYKACQLAGVSKTRAYYCYNHDDEFATDWDNAQIRYIESKKRRRATLRARSQAATL